MHDITGSGAAGHGLRTPQAYGIDAGNGWVAVVRAARRGSAETLYQGPELPAGLAAQIEAERRRGRAVTAASLPAGEALVRWLSVPFASRSKALKVLPSLLDVQLPFPLEECVSLIAAVRRGEGEVRTLAVAARESAVRDRLTHLADLGVDPVLLDHEGLALWEQAVRERPENATAPRAEVYLGHDRTLTVLGQAGELLSVHHGRIGRALAGGSGPEAREQAGILAARLLRVARALSASEDVPVAWSWSGPGAADEDLRTFLEGEVSTGLRAGFHVHRDPGALLARALATRALNGRRLPACDLRLGSLRHPMRARAEKRGRRAAAALTVAAGLVLAAVNGSWLAVLNARQQQMEERLAERTRALTGFQAPRGQEILVARRVLEEQGSSFAPFQEAFQPSQAHLLAALLEEARQRNMTIEALSLARDHLSIQGLSSDWADSERLADRLRSLGRTVDPPTRSEARGEEGVRFVLRGGRQP